MRVAVLVKQVPVPEEMSLGEDGRLRREGVPLEMNAFCRRAVTAGVALAPESGDSCTVFTLGPESASRVLLEALACGATSAVHLCDPEFAGSDTLATARALGAALRLCGPFDVILVGRNSIDSDTGQVGPAVAEYLDLAFVPSSQKLEVVDGLAHCEVTLDDGLAVVEATLPCVIACAERLCQPCKAPVPEARGGADERIRVLRGDELGGGPWGAAGSPTAVGSVRPIHASRARRRLLGNVSSQVEALVTELVRSGVLEGLRRTQQEPLEAGRVPTAASPSSDGADPGRDSGPRSLGVVIEPGRSRSARELLGAAASLAAPRGGTVSALSPHPVDPALLGSWGADQVIGLRGWEAAEDVAKGVAEWGRGAQPWAILGPSTMWGREVAARVSMLLEAGLTGDAVGLDLEGGRLVAWKTALSGSALVPITAASRTQMATVRPGVMPLLSPRAKVAGVTELSVVPRRRAKMTGYQRAFDLEDLLAARAIVGVGSGVPNHRYSELTPLLEALDAQLACTRRVADQGWLPRGRQVGLTGVTVKPNLYLAFGISGSANHMVGLREAKCVVAVNSDPAAEIFDGADFGIVGDWAEVARELAVVVGATLRTGA